MFKLFQRLPIKNKLILVIFGAAMFVMLASFVFILFFNIQNIRSETVERSRSEMNVLAQDFVKIVMFSDAYMAADVVSKLRTFSAVYNVFLYNADGENVFRYENSPAVSMDAPAVTPGKIDTEIVFGKDAFQMFLPLRYAGGEYGWVFVRTSTEQQNRMLAEYYMVFAAAVPIMMLVSYLLAFWLQRYFSQPIVVLAERVRRIASEQDFGQQVSSDDPNEIGSLYRSIGQLLATIQSAEQQLRHGESRLEAIISIAGNALISIDEEHRITLFNHQAEHIFGYAAHEIIGQPLNILLPDHFRKTHTQKIDAFSNQGIVMKTALKRDDVQGLRKNGEEFPIEASISQVVLEGKKIFTVALTDVTQRRQTEQELAAYRNHLEEVVEDRTSELRAKNSELEAFSYSVAHDLRAPLRSITSFSQILLEDAADKLDKGGLDHLTRIIRAGHHMSELIDGILRLAQIGRSQITLAEVDISALVVKIRSRLERDQPQRKMRWAIQPEITGRGDPQLLSVVMENLIGNAWKYTSKNPQATIEFGVAHQNGKRVFFVKDNGAGFDMKYAENLFAVFHRLHKAEEFDGVGVGLATVRRIIQRHGGEIWSEAEIGKGATFYFTLRQ